MAFTNAELVAVRKFCGYGVKTIVSLTLEGAYGNMEYRLNVMDADEVAMVRTSFLSSLQDLEDGILTSASNMDTQQAAVWTRNPKEMQERTALYNGLRHRLCAYIGVAPGPGLGGGRVVRC
jgi:hypothetical protein